MPYSVTMPYRLHWILFGLVLFCSFTPAISAQWLSFSDYSATNILTDENAPDPVGLTDTFEKDLEPGDLDRDGDMDVVIVRKVRFSNPGGKRNVLYINDGQGIFTDRTAELAPDFLDETDDRDVALVDVNGDGWLDMVTATTFSDQPRVYINLQNDGDGQWLGFEYDSAENRIPPFTPGPKFCAVAAGDIDDDGDQDLFFVDYSNDLEDRLLINNGLGFFTDETLDRMTAAMSESAFGTDAQIVDMNGDGALDIIKLTTLGGNPNSVRIIYNAGGANIGNFDFMQIAQTGSPYMMEVADLNGDMLPDIYVVEDGQDEYLLNNGNDSENHAIFTTRAVTGSPNTSSFGGNVKLMDLDKNGYRDAIIADVDTDFQICDREPVALRNLGNAPNVTLTDPLGGVTPNWMPTGTFDFAVADFNGDSWLDLWAGTCTGNKLYFAPAPLFRDGFESGDTSAWSNL